MKPFDLQKALAGEPVVTRDGHKVIDIHYFEKVTGPYSIAAYVEGDDEFQMFTKKGNFQSRGETHFFDLFMDEPTKWVNIYYNEHLNHVTTGAIYETEEEAQKHSENVANFQCTIKLIL